MNRATKFDIKAKWTQKPSNPAYVHARAARAGPHAAHHREGIDALQPGEDERADEIETSGRQDGQGECPEFAHIRLTSLAPAVWSPTPSMIDAVGRRSRR
jgi:hypothetical protein